MSELISIIVPVYGVEKYLRQCVDSVLAQTYSNWELILVDDGSQDACPAICDEYVAKDSRIKVIHQENGGLSCARNAGLKDSYGSFVTFLDADDAFHPRFLEISLDVINRMGADVSCVCFTTNEFSVNSYKSDSSFGCVEYMCDIFYQKRYDCTHSACGKLYKRSLLPKLPFTVGIGYEDLDAFYRYFPQFEKIAVSYRKLYYYRQNPESYLHKFNIGRADVLDVTDRIVEYFGEKGEYPNKDLLRAAKDRRMSAHFNIFCLMSVNKYHDNDLEKRCWNVIKKERLNSLLNPNVRLKNKIGAFLSYFGKSLLRILARFIYT